MEEYFDVCDAQGVPTGVALPRSEVHRQGLWHRSSHLWVVDGPRVLLQQRHPSKESDPGRWDIAVAGHLSAGQSPLQAILREAHEELGLVFPPDSLTFLGVSAKEYVGRDFVDREWQYQFGALWSGNLDTLVLQADEVVAVRWMPVDEYRRAAMAGDEAYVGRREDWGNFEAWYRTVTG